MLGGANSRAIELKPGDVIVLRASNHRAPVDQPQAAVQAKVLAGAKQELAAKNARAAADAVASAIAAGTPFDKAIAPLGATHPADAATPAAPTDVKLQVAKAIERRQAGVPGEVLKAVFSAPAPAAGKAASGVVAVGQDVAVYALTTVKPGVADAEATKDLRPYTRALGGIEVAAYVRTLRNRAEVHIDPKLFE